MASSTHTCESDQTQSILKLTTIDLVGGIFCNICNETYGNKKDYDTHYVKHTGSKDILYTCVVCRKEVAGYPSFRGHCYTNHVIKGRYKCDYCEKLFSKLPTLQYHVKQMHSKSFRCNTCKKKFSSKKELRLHEVIHTYSNGPMTCLACHKDISSIDICKKHVDLHSSYVYTCPICEENIPAKENSADHLRKHFGYGSLDKEVDLDPDEMIEQLGAVSCIFCAIICKNRVEFDAHFSCEHGDEDIVYSCVVCGRQFEKYSLFRTHINNHFINNRYECDVCKSTFPRLSVLVSHMSTCQLDKAKKVKHKLFACLRCNHRYMTEPKLRAHMQDAHNMHVRRCMEIGCGKVFEKLRDMVVHQREHHTHIQNWCRQCGQLFTSLVSCEQHLDVHRKACFPCPVCNKTYGEKHLVLRHIPHHFETVLHLCKVCGKVYHAKNRLIEHLQSHSDTKIHSCTYCPKSFTKQWHLQQHLNIHTGLKPHTCAICDKSFTCYPNWRKHMLRLHTVSSKKCIDSDVSDKQSSKHDRSTKIDHTKDNEIVNSKSNKWEPFAFYDDESEMSMESESIDNIVIDKELQLFGNQEQGDFKSLPMPNEAQEACSPEAMPNTVTEVLVPLEYGPEFSTTNLDDYILPHIDPLLTIRNDQVLPAQNQPIKEEPFRPDTILQPIISTKIDIENNHSKWEPPMITKVFSEFYSYEEAGRLTISDIF